ncbi:hypothetical protein KAU39_00880 [bacterium]|nr:hypothetical protein [bacterium]
MKRVNVFLILLVLSITGINLSRAAAKPIELDGTLGGALARYSYTDAYGEANSITPLNLSLGAMVPFSDDRQLLFDFSTEESQIVTPVRNTRVGLGLQQNLFPLLNKKGKMKLGYRFNGYSDRINNNSSFSGNELSLISNLFMRETMNVKFKYVFFDKSLDNDNADYNYHNIGLGTDMKLRNRRDTLNLNFDLFKKDAGTDAACFDRNAVDARYVRELSLGDEIESAIHWRGINYASAGDISDRNETGLEFSYLNGHSKGSTRWGGEFYLERYPNNEGSEFNLYEFFCKRSLYASEKWRRRSSNHRIEYFDADFSEANDYFEWLWDMEAHSYFKKSRGFYFNNGVKMRKWVNNNDVIKNQHFLEDIVSVGVEWSSLTTGSFSVGPVLGHRFYIDPNAENNDVSSDDSLFKNPANFLLYGIKMVSGFSLKKGMSMNIAYNYRMFLNYMGKPEKFSTELSDLSLQLRQTIADNLQLSCDIAYADNANDNGPITIGVNRMNAQMKLEYKFSKLIGE